MILGFGNNVVSSLASDITASQTTFSVIPGDGPLFASLLTSDFSNKSTTLKNYAKITLTDSGETAFEVCHLTAVSGDTLTVIRGQEGTAAKGWALKDVVANFATRGSENAFPQIAHIQSGFYTSGTAGGTANALTLELPTTFFLNGSADWVLKTPIVVYPSQNNTGAATLQLTLGGRVLGTFKLYKGNKAELVANDIVKDVALVCLMDNTKTFFNVANPGAIYAGLGTAAFRDVTTSASDITAGRVLKVGDGGLLGETLSVTDANLLTRDGLASMLFKQGGGNGTSHFGGYGVGVHLRYGLGNNSQELSGNLFIDSSGNLTVEWLSVSKTDGSIVTQRLQKMVPDVRKVNGHSLANDANVTAQDIFNGQVVDIGNAVDLNTLTTPGLYRQAANAQAASGKNYPEANAGSLEVYKHAGITQVYRVYNNSRQYARTLYSGTWSAWGKVYDTNNKPSAGDVGAIPLAGSTAVTGIVRNSAEFQTTSANSYRMVYGNYGVFWRQDGGNLYLMLTNSGDQYGSFNSLRPLTISLANGYPTMSRLNLTDWTNFDARYQAKGSYTPAGQAYTKAESDARYQKINTASRAANGWYKDTNTGMIFQWGKNASTAVGNVTITFPIAFPNACLNVQNTLIRNAGSPGEKPWGFVTSFNNSTVSLTGDAKGSYWFAVGY